MNSELWHRAKEIYNSVLERQPGQREAFIARACAGDETLRKEVESMLGWHEKAADFIESPALEVAGRAMADQLTAEESTGLTGRRLMHYTIREKIGEGGMGIVYKALDTHLQRPVAIKVLTPQIVADPDRRLRFVQEARAASALNHPNIIAIYDIDQTEGTDFIAMEYVTGRTLAELIPRKGMKLTDALKQSIQIADALAAAHAAGIVHRDLKPANIMVTETGLAKVLDFGLAKLTQPTQEEASGTVPSKESLTGAGRIMGTVAYMSPEQAEGRAVDARSDIFSFGTVLYEMLTGRQAFAGDSVISTLSAILNKEAPPMGAEIPHALEMVVTRCMRKDPSKRFQHMDDVKVELEELKEAADSGRLQVASGAPRQFSPIRFALVVFTVIVFAVAGWHWLGRDRSAEPERVLTPVPLTSYPGYELKPSFSPDGTQVAFQWCPDGASPNCDIYIKQIDVEPPFRLTTDPAEECSPAWSPDGNFIAFVRVLSPTKAALVIVPQRGGQERVLGETNYLYASEPSLAWTPDSKWLAFLDAASPGLFLLSIQTGERRRLSGDGRDHHPAFSPDGRTLAFTRVMDILLLRLTESYLPQGSPELLTSVDDENCATAWTSDGSEILFSKEVLASSGLWRMTASASASPRRLPLASQDYGFWPAVSRRGNRLAYVVGRDDLNIWRVEMREPGVEPGAPAPLISSTQEDAVSCYSPDGQKIAFASDRTGAVEVWVCKSDGSNSTQLTTSGHAGNFMSWSPDGRTIVYPRSDGGYQSVYAISANAGLSGRLTTGPYVDKNPIFSRDGQSVFFSSNRSGSDEIWKIPASGGDPVQVTPNGEGRDLPKESPDGKFLYYMKGWPRHCSVWKMPVGGGEETMVLDSVDHRGLWAIWKEGIYFFRPPDAKGHSDLYLNSFATGRTTKVLRIDKPIGYGLAPSPDGRTVLYNQLDRAGADLMLVEGFR